MARTRCGPVSERSGSASRWITASGGRLSMWVDALSRASQECGGFYAYKSLRGPVRCTTNLRNYCKNLLPLCFKAMLGNRIGLLR